VANSQKIQIIGIGDDGLSGLTAHARELTESADMIVAAEGAFARLGPVKADKVSLGTNLDEIVAKIAAASNKKIVVLASGDPLFYGIARFLCDKLGKDRFEVVPHVSSMQLAFARVKESWEDAYLTNVANHPLTQVVEKVRTATTVGLFTSEAHPPQAIAKELLARKIDYFTAYVCENLGSPDERVTHGELSEIAGYQFGPLNVLILVRKPDAPDRPTESIGRRLFGNPDEAFLQSQPKQGMLTPAEVRAMALGELDLGPRSVVWDVGAGSGSVAIEAAQLAKEGQVFALEMDAEDHRLIVENAKRFGVANLSAIHGRAPEAWANLPKPDAVFIGGSGREVCALAEAAYAELRGGGRLVASVGSIENLAAVHEMLQQKSDTAKVWMVNIARGIEQLERVRFQALNPTFIVAAVKPA
jgi:precorrin-6Y C5,15-methyltransferase (decarboxylating)